jgi:large subunit ribosomal protein L4
MAQVDVLNQKGEKVGDIDLDDKVFGAQIKDHLVQRVVVWQLAKKRKGTASTKTRSDIKGGGKKPWRQKGTGRARAGTSSSPVWTGGGTVFGPHPRSYAFSVPKKVRKAAMRSALSSKLSDNKLTVLDKLELEEPKTKLFHKAYEEMGLKDHKALFITADKDEKLHLSSRNIYGVQVMPVEGMNVYDLLRYDKLVLLADAVPRIHERLG